MGRPGRTRERRCRLSCRAPAGNPRRVADGLARWRPRLEARLSGAPTPLLVLMRLPVATLALATAGALGLGGGGRQADVDAGTIRGRVTETSVAPMVGGRPLVGDLGSAVRDATDRRRAVVYVDPAPRPALEELPAGRARMDQRNEEFIPHVLAITVGTVVDFPNDDTKFHNVFSLSHVKQFDLGRYPV